MTEYEIIDWVSLDIGIREIRMKKCECCEIWM